MLDYKQLVTPRRHGGVLIAPDVRTCARIAQENAKGLNSSEAQIAGKALRDLRSQTRLQLGIDPARPVIAVGHQPDFIHAGVWAKNVFGCRLAQSLHGVAVNIGVDSDAPKRLSIRIPVRHDGRWMVQEVHLGKLRSGYAYEQVQPLRADDIKKARNEIESTAVGFSSGSMVPSFFAGVASSNPPDWVNQVIAGRKAVESEYDIELLDLRISRAWWSPLASHLLQDARGFAISYNRALADYRRENKVHSDNRPIPDLLVEGARIELPFWLYRDDRPRTRVFVTVNSDDITLLTDDEPVTALSTKSIASADDVVDLTSKKSGWFLRPRALMTTIWARLLLADLFVHGIGGAKYDRISDRIIESYFGLRAPEIACVTASLYVNRSCEDKVDREVLERELRDATWNPQRHITDAETRGLEELLKKRVSAAKRAKVLTSWDGQNHDDRQEVYHEIRRLNEQIHAANPQMLQDLRRRVEAAKYRQSEQRVLCDREYFFALHSRKNLELLLDALPGTDDFV